MDLTYMIGALALAGAHNQTAPTYADTTSISGEYCELADPVAVGAKALKWFKEDTIIQGGVKVAISEKEKVTFSCGKIGCSLNTRAHPRVFVSAEVGSEVQFFDARGTVTIINVAALLEGPSDAPAQIACTID